MTVFCPMCAVWDSKDVHVSEMQIKHYMYRRLLALKASHLLVWILIQGANAKQYLTIARIDNKSDDKNEIVCR